MSGFMAFNILRPVPSKQFFTSLWFVMLISSLRSGISQLLPFKCNNGTAYAKGSAFERNLNTVLDSLIRNTSRTGFNTSSYGQSPNKIYGLLQCRGDTSQSDCLTCSQNANISVRQDCGNAIGGRVWLDLCYLRYENYSFFSRLDPQVYQELVNTQKITNPDVFRRGTRSLLNGVAAKALAPLNKGFAAGSSHYASSRNVYCMVQCLEDLSTDDCRLCLSSAITAIYELSEQGARTLLGSCSARYEIYDFLLSYAAPLPSLEGPSTVGGLTPPSAKTPISMGGHGPTSNESSKALPIILGAVGVALVALIVSVFAIRRKLKSFIFPSPVNTRQEEDVRESVSESLLQQEQVILTWRH